MSDTNDAATLGDFVVRRNAKLDPAEHPELPYLSLEHLASRSNQILGHGYGSDVRSTKALFKPGDILFGRLRPYLNKVCMPEFGGMCSTDILVFQESDRVHPNFLMYLLSSRRVIGYATHKSTGDLPRVSFQTLARLPVDMPELEEQRRITKRIDHLLAKAHEPRRRLSMATEIAGRLRSSVIARLCSEGFEVSEPQESVDDLLKQLREMAREGRGRRSSKKTEPVSDPPIEIPSHWRWARLRDLTALITKGTTPTSVGLKFTDSGVLFVKVESLVGGAIDHSQCAFIDATAHDVLSRSQLATGDVLISIAGTLGRTAIVREEDVPANTNQAVAIVRPFLPQMSHFLSLMLDTPWVRLAVARSGRGSSMANLNLEQIGDFPVPLAPLNEQERFIEEMESISARCRSTLLNLARAEEGLQSLYDSVLERELGRVALVS